tara:strand:- start:915 stop:1142 length:228 start_codon:yes stop_codon:yes gene_type:complete
MTDEIQKDERWGIIYDDSYWIREMPLHQLGLMAKRKTLLRRLDIIARQNRYDDPSVDLKKYEKYIVMRGIIGRSI